MWHLKNDEDLKKIQDEIKGTKKDNSGDKKEVGIKSLKKIKESLKENNEKLKSTGTGPGTLYHKNLEEIKKIDAILKSSGVSEE